MRYDEPPLDTAQSTTRFDDVIRSERYYTATLLPAILLHNNLDGLAPFLDLVTRKATVLDGQPTERNGDGKRAPRLAEQSRWSKRDAEIITEFHIARDLTVAGRLSSPEPLTPSNDLTIPDTRDAPDMVIVLDDELIVCEAKFFHPHTVTSLNRQLHSQRRQIRHLFAVRPQLRAYRHVAIVPADLGGTPACDALLTWSEIAQLADRVLGPGHYVTRRLQAGVAYFEYLVGERGSSDGERNYDEILPLDTLLSLCQTRGDAIQVGHVGGATDLLRRPVVYLELKPWKWRDPATNKGTILRRNWISGAEFVSLVEQLRGRATP
jgi:hypothetical protein